MTDESRTYSTGNETRIRASHAFVLRDNAHVCARCGIAMHNAFLFGAHALSAESLDLYTMCEDVVKNAQGRVVADKGSCHAK